MDPDHTVFLDGNTYATEFDVFDEAVRERRLHAPRLRARGRPRRRLPGAPTAVRDKVARAKFLQRSEYARKTGTPILVGEFGPIYTGDRGAGRAALPHPRPTSSTSTDDDQASWSIWTYKDIGRQGIVSVQAGPPYRQRFDEFVAKKERLGVDQWGSDGDDIRPVSEPFQDQLAQEFPHFDPYPWGRRDWVRTLLLNITVAQPLAYEYAELFRGLDDADLIALADSFALASCDQREPLVGRLRADLSRPA